MKTTPIKKKQGRPKNPKRETVKSLYLRVRLTPNELTLINEISKKSFDKSQSETVRNLIFSNPISVKIIKPEFESILSTLNKISASCNYIKTYKRKNLVQIISSIEGMQNIINELNNKIEPMGGIGQLYLSELESNLKTHTFE